ncbi:hypothetical protein [Promicromonospora sukumoe]|uniref:hypothetical protein n=1 Tax=Promicromonospora sukumoe TaxID=88382 RepID=UPI0003650007|nr:hypothetical protein [Promicromonospora sukumoe]
MLRTRTVVTLVIAGLALVGAVLAAPPLWLALDESAVPPVSTFPDLPDGARVTSVDIGCGSGGCWQELTVLAPAGTTGAALAAEVAPEGEECPVRSLIDLRRVCTGVVATGTLDEPDATDAVRFYVQYDRS